jgi:hypothetical protein
MAADRRCGTPGPGPLRFDDPQNPHEDLMDALRDVFPEGRGVERKFINRPARHVF